MASDGNGTKLLHFLPLKTKREPNVVGRVLKGGVEQRSAVFGGSLWLPTETERSSSTPTLARPMRFERTAYRVGVCHSIQLSYGRVSNLLGYYNKKTEICKVPRL